MDRGGGVDRGGLAIKPRAMAHSTYTSGKVKQPMTITEWHRELADLCTDCAQAEGGDEAGLLRRAHWIGARVTTAAATELKNASCKTSPAAPAAGLVPYPALKVASGASRCP